MRTLWNVDGVEVVLTGITPSGDPAFAGYATYSIGATHRVVQWTAVPHSEGFVVEVLHQRGPQHVYGSTLNLGAEVAAAVRRCC